MCTPVRSLQCLPVWSPQLRSLGEAAERAHTCRSGHRTLGARSRAGCGTTVEPAGTSGRRLLPACSVRGQAGSLGHSQESLRPVGRGQSDASTPAASGCRMPACLAFSSGDWRDRRGTRRCGQEGHWSANCPNRAAGRASGATPVRTADPSAGHVLARLRVGMCLVRIELPAAAGVQATRVIVDAGAACRAQLVACRAQPVRQAVRAHPSALQMCATSAVRAQPSWPANHTWCLPVITPVRAAHWKHARRQHGALGARLRDARLCLKWLSAGCAQPPDLQGLRLLKGAGRPVALCTSSPVLVHCFFLWLLIKAGSC